MKSLVVLSLLLSSSIACIPMKVPDSNRCTKMLHLSDRAGYCTERQGSDICEDAETTTTSTSCQNSALKLVIIADDGREYSALGGLVCIGMHWFFKDTNKMVDSKYVNAHAVCAPRD